MTDEEMIMVLRAKGYRVQPPIDQKTCKHPRLRGSGMIGCDGASKSEGYCQDCGYNYSHETPGDPNYVAPIMQI